MCFRIGICRVFLCFWFVCRFFWFFVDYPKKYPVKTSAFFFRFFCGHSGFWKSHQKKIRLSIFHQKDVFVIKNDKLLQTGGIYHCGKYKLARKSTFWLRFGGFDDCRSAELDIQVVEQSSIALIFWLIKWLEFWLTNLLRIRIISSAWLISYLTV